MLHTAVKRQRAIVRSNREQPGTFRIEAGARKAGTGFSRRQHALLMKCSAGRDMAEWNEWRNHNPAEPVLLQGVNIAKAWLRGADLSRADFSGANLRGADLSGAKLDGFDRLWADLNGADFSNADLCGADFRGANLSGANFSRAYLYYTNLSWTDLRGADFSNADLWAFLFRANLTSVDLDRANRRFRLPGYLPGRPRE